MRLGDDHQTYYDTLELTSDASPQEIRSAYLRLKAAYGKDSLALYSLVTSDDTETTLKQIEEAYLILSHPEKRRAYDQAQGLAPALGATVHSISSDVHKVDSFPTGASVAAPAPRVHEDLQARAAATPKHDDGIEAAIHEEKEWTGSFLRRVREARGVTMDELSDHTRITKHYLMAIEDQDFGKLPAAVYLRGFLIQIAKRLKVPQEPLVTLFIQRFRTMRPDRA